MTSKLSGRRGLTRTVALALTLTLTALGAGLGASAQADPGHFPPPGGGHGLAPGNLLVSRSVYEPDPSLTAGVTELPAGCVTGCALAKAGGAYPEVWNNDLVRRKLRRHLEDLPGPAHAIGLARQHARSAEQRHARHRHGADQMITSFSSKSELALNLSTRGRYVTFMGYLAPVDTLDVSNANTPGVIDPTNPVPGAYYRVVAQLDSQGQFQFTETNAYSGNNGRAAILSERTRRARDLHGGQRRQRRKPAAGRDHRRRRRADPQAPVRTDAGAPAGTRAPDPRRQLQRHAARRQSRQDRQGRPTSAV